VAGALAIKRANFVVLIDSLQVRGFVRRDPVKGDRRAVALHLTEAGSDLADRLDALVAEHDAAFVARIGAPNRAILLDLLTRIAGD
jgi:DNA-binding MarR family transcriptional regulator